MRTIFPKGNEGFPVVDTVLTRQKPESKGKLRFPKTITAGKGRNTAKVVIYGQTAARPYYRIGFYERGKRFFQNFLTSSEALNAAETKADDLAKHGKAPVLNQAQLSDAQAAFEVVGQYNQATGKRLSLLVAVRECVEAHKRLGDRLFSEVIDSFLATTAVVQRMDIGQAVEEFIAVREQRTKAGDGKRAQMSPKYAYNLAIMLRRFASTFPNTAVCDLTKRHLDTFIGSLKDAASQSRNKRKAVSAKSRKHYRATVRQFLDWCVRKDYLSANHRLGEAEGMQPEPANTAEVGFYTAKQFHALLETATGEMQAIVAIGGLAGLRTAELLRLDWADVWRVDGHIEVTAGKSKTRQRRLIEICPALAAWLEPYRCHASGPVWSQHEITFQQHFVKLCENAKLNDKPVKVQRKHNGLRHAFVTYHYALNANENLTSAQAGHSPAMIHQHYKGLATKAEAEKWFAVVPAAKAPVTDAPAADNVNQTPTQQAASR